MRNVLADLAIETEAALALSTRVARAIDESAGSEAEAALARIGTTVAKYWNCKRAPTQIGEALECLGGAGYIEDSILPRLYREAPINSIWEGSGNVMCLDVLRAIAREPSTLAALFEELDTAKGTDDRLDTAVETLRDDLNDPADLELCARSLTERMATTLQGALLCRYGVPQVAEAFCASRLSSRWTGAYGALPPDVDLDGIITRAMPTAPGDDG